MAISSESRMESQPSSTALLMSETSARVGLGESTIDQSIWVAMQETLAASLAFLTISFCAIGTRSIGISTPKSPRATITLSTSWRIESRLSIASARSSFAITGALLPILSKYALASRTSWPVRTKETATQSTPCSTPNRRAALSSSVITGRSMDTPGRLTPLYEEMVPPLRTRVDTSRPSVSSTSRHTVPSAMKIRLPWLKLFRTLGSGKGITAGSLEDSSGVIRYSSPW